MRTHLKISLFTATFLLLSTGVSNGEEGLLAGRWYIEGADETGSYVGEAQVSYSGVKTAIQYEITLKDGKKRRLIGSFVLQGKRQYSVIATSLNGRAAPKTGQVLKRLRFGDLIDPIEERDGWIHGLFEGKKYWLSKRWLKVVATSPGPLKAALRLPNGLADRLNEGLGAGTDSAATVEGAFTWKSSDSLLAVLTSNGGKTHRETWSRLPGRLEDSVLRFVLKGTNRPIANATVVLGGRSGDRFKQRLSFKTNSAGLVKLDVQSAGELPTDGLEAFFMRRKEDVSKRPKSKTDKLETSTWSTKGVHKVELSYYGARWTQVYDHMLSVDDIVGSGGFRWNTVKNDWDTPILDCITSALFAAAAAAEHGARGLYKPLALDNMLRDKRGRPMVENSSFRTLLTPAFGTKQTMARLATSGSVYRGVCRWPWRDMEWRWTGTSPCGCGAHVTPATIIQNKDKLGRINILSMSQAKRPEGPEYGPMSRWTMRYEYSVLVLIKRDDGSLYCYHATSSHSAESRVKTFKDEVEYWAVDSYGSKETDCRYLVWKVDDAQIDPFFWLDDKGAEFTPEHIIKNLKDQAGEPGSTYPAPPATEESESADGESGE
jgi:hypothetical protein